MDGQKAGHLRPASPLYIEAQLTLLRSSADELHGNASPAEERVEASDEFIGPERRGAAVVPDRRQHPRFAIDAWAEVLVLDGSLLFRGRVLDISVAGCFIQTEARLHMRQRTPVEMIFRVKDSVFRIRATSRMVRPGIGAGFLFAEMSERTRFELDALIAELGSAAELDR